jgi:uncharacterized protein (UPF0335 family)
MQTITSENSLRDAISRLEQKRIEEGIIIKNEIHDVYESLKPVNLIKNAFKEVAESSEIKDNILNNSIGLLAGYLSKKAFEAVTKSPAKRVIGTAIMFGVKNLVAQHPETVKKIVGGIFNFIRIKLEKKNEA